MKDVIYLAVDRSGVRRMNKSMPSLNRGEIPIKINLEVKDGAFGEPVIEQRIVIEDWHQGTNIGDVELREGIITEAEAQMIRDRRLALMHQVLADHGYKVEAPPDATVAGPGDEWPGDRDG